MNSRLSKWELMPFGGRLRVCPGQQLAMTDVAYVLMRLVGEFAVIENRDTVWD